jgi:hypothetical protein
MDREDQITRVWNRATPSSPRGQPALERVEADVGQFRVECLGSNVQVIGRIDAEPVDVLGQVRRQLGEEFGGDLPALGDERADQLGHVQGGVEDDAIGQPGVVSSVPGVAIRWLRSRVDSPRVSEDRIAQSAQWGRGREIWRRSTETS